MCYTHRHWDECQSWTWCCSYYLSVFFLFFSKKKKRWTLVNIFCITEKVCTVLLRGKGFVTFSKKKNTRKIKTQTIRDKSDPVWCRAPKPGMFSFFRCLCSDPRVQEAVICRKIALSFGLVSFVKQHLGATHGEWFFWWHLHIEPVEVTNHVTPTGNSSYSPSPTATSPWLTQRESCWWKCYSVGLSNQNWTQTGK